MHTTMFLGAFWVILRIKCCTAPTIMCCTRSTDGDKAAVKSGLQNFHHWHLSPGAVKKATCLSYWSYCLAHSLWKWQRYDRYRPSQCCCQTGFKIFSKWNKSMGSCSKITESKKDTSQVPYPQKSVSCAWKWCRVLLHLAKRSSTW